MRAIVALTLVLLGLNKAAPEPEYSSLLTGYLQAPNRDAASSLVEIESAIGKSDRLTVADSQPPVSPVEIQRSGTVEAPPPPDSTIKSDTTSPDSDTNQGADVTLGDLCNALLTSAQDNDLPVQFFANLIWQESHLQDDAVSPKGALGIAQFMPKTAAKSGLDDPFDPRQAIPASARLLRALREQFGNLGFVAAAYNAGPRRVSEWLERRRGLPRETRGYVVQVTGRSVDQWRTTPPDDTALTFVRRLPCRNLPAFAEVEQAQLEQAQLEQTESEAAARPEQAAPTAQDAHPHVADRRHWHTLLRHEKFRSAAHDLHDGKRHAERERLHRPAHERHSSA